MIDIESISKLISAMQDGDEICIHKINGKIYPELLKKGFSHYLFELRLLLFPEPNDVWDNESNFIGALEYFINQLISFISEGKASEFYQYIAKEVNVLSGVNVYRENVKRFRKFIDDIYYIKDNRAELEKKLLDVYQEYIKPYGEIVSKKELPGYSENKVEFDNDYHLLKGNNRNEPVFILWYTTPNIVAQHMGYYLTNIQKYRMRHMIRHKEIVLMPDGNHEKYYKNEKGERFNEPCSYQEKTDYKTQAQLRKESILQDESIKSFVQEVLEYYRSSKSKSKNQKINFDTFYKRIRESKDGKLNYAVYLLMQEHHFVLKKLEIL